MISVFNKTAKAEKLRQEQYRKAYESYQTELNQKYQPLFVTLWLLWLHGGHTTIKKEQINGLDRWAPGQIKVSLSKSNKTLFEIRRTGYDDNHLVQQYNLTTFTPDRQEYQDFPVEYAQQLFDFLAYYQFNHEMVKMLKENGHRIPKTNEYLENLLRYTMLQAGAKFVQECNVQNELLLHNLINLKRYSK